MKGLKVREPKVWLPLVAMATMGFGLLGAGSTLPAAEAPSQPNATTAKSENERNIVYRMGKNGRVVAVALAKMPDSPAFARFERWMRKYTAAPADKKSALETEGVQLAQARRKAMAALIPRDPQRALELSIGMAARKALPLSVASRLETILSGRGDYSVASERTLKFQGRTYKAFVYGHRKELLSKNDLPFYGVALDGNVAIDENPVRVLAKGEPLPKDLTLSRLGTHSPVSNQDASDGVVGIVGSTVYYFADQQELQLYNAKLWDAEAVIGPNEHG